MNDSRSYYIQNVSDSGHNLRLLWKSVHCLLHPGADYSLYQSLNTDALANSLNDFFIDTLRRLSETIINGLLMSNVVNSISPPKPVTTKLNELPLVTPAEVLQLINSALSKTSTLDILPTSILKLCGDELAVMIAHVMNRSFETSIFPTSMKVGLLTPLLKKPGFDTSEYKNFRPISNLSMILKIIERLALHHIRTTANIITKLLSVSIGLPCWPLDRVK